MVCVLVQSVQAPVRPLTLAREELRALPRSAFGLGAVAVVLALLVPIAALAYGEDDGIRDALVFMWLVAELVVAVVVAARVAAARRSRFVDSLYTTPLRQPTWLAAQAIVGGVLALLVLVPQLPFLLVHAAWLGVPTELPTMVLAALGMGAFAVALGLFCGVIVGEAGPGAAAGLAGGISFLSFVLFIIHGMTVTSPPSTIQPALLRATSLSPLALVSDGAGIGVFDVAAAEPWRPIAGLAAMVIGLAGAAWWTYTRGQGPLGWEARGGRGVIVALIALAVVVPVASAEVSFRELEDDDDDDMFSRGEHTQVTFVPRDAPIEDDAFTYQAMVSAPDLPLDKPVELDALVLLLVPDGATARAVRIQIDGSASVRVDAGGTLTVANGKPSGHAPAGLGWDTTAEGPARPVYRVPVVLRAVAVEALGDSPARVEVRTEFVANGKTLVSHARITLDAEIEGATTMLAIAGAPLPGAAVAALVTRRIRTR